MNTITHARPRTMTKAEVLAENSALRAENNELRADLAACRADHKVTLDIMGAEITELRAKFAAPKPAAAKPLGSKLPAYFAARTEQLFIRAYRTAHKCAVVPAEHIRAWRELQA